jgi:MSHA biogenesis protein MshP
MIPSSLLRHPGRLGRLRRSAGVGLVTAIFLLVVLAGLGVAMVTIFTSQQQSSNLDVQGARAYQAARAGIEWGLFQQLRNGSCNDATSFRLPAGSALAGFAVTVQCTVVGADPLKRWVIVATACNQPGAGDACYPSNPSNSPDYVERQVEVQI